MLMRCKMFIKFTGKEAWFLSVNSPKFIFLFFLPLAGRSMCVHEYWTTAHSVLGLATVTHHVAKNKLKNNSGELGLTANVARVCPRLQRALAAPHYTL